MTDEAFARLSRERCAPLECDAGEHCWVTLGKDACTGSLGSRISRCLDCHGRIRVELWLTPTRPAASLKPGLSREPAP